MHYLLDLISFANNNESLIIIFSYYNYYYFSNSKYNYIL